MHIRTYAFADAARISGIPEEELRTAFKDGLIMARRQENTGLYHIDETELAQYLRRSRKQELSDRSPLRRILVIDDDARFAESLRLSVERVSIMEGRAVTWGKDAVGLLHTYKPHLCLLGWRAPDDQMRLVVEVLRMREFKRHTRVLAYGGTTRIDQGQEPDVLLKSLKVSNLYSRARGSRELIQECFRALALEPMMASSRKTDR